VAHGGIVRRSGGQRRATAVRRLGARPLRARLGRRRPLRPCRARRRRCCQDGCCCCWCADPCRSSPRCAQARVGLQRGGGELQGSGKVGGRARGRERRAWHERRHARWWSER
ncbi:unnamed protein product, partial [Closterium sp. NIES-53]